MHFIFAVTPMRETLFLFPHDTGEDTLTAAVIGPGPPTGQPSKDLNQAFPAQVWTLQHSALPGSKCLLTHWNILYHIYPLIYALLP